VTLNTVPLILNSVKLVKAVPYKVPAESRINPPSGVAPSEFPFNWCRTIMLPALFSLNTVP
jgi:hypothetical protein